MSAAGLVAHAPDDDAVGEAEGLGLPDELLLEARGVRGLGGFDDQVADVGGRGLLGPSAAVSVGGLALLDGLAAVRRSLRMPSLMRSTFLGADALVVGLEMARQGRAFEDWRPGSSKTLKGGGHHPQAQAAGESARMEVFLHALLFLEPQGPRERDFPRQEAGRRTLPRPGLR